LGGDLTGGLEKYFEGHPDGGFEEIFLGVTPESVRHAGGGWGDLHTTWGNYSKKFLIIIFIEGYHHPPIYFLFFNFISENFFPKRKFENIFSNRMNSSHEH
jgi:hypothetical protein